MKLTGIEKLDIQILLDVYKMEYEHEANPSIASRRGEKEITDFKKEYFFAVDRLEKEGYLLFNGQALIKGGWIDPKYHHNIIDIFWQNVRISSKGKDVIKEAININEDIEEMSEEEINTLNNRIREGKVMDLGRSIVNNIKVENGAQFNQHQGSGDINAVQNNSLGGEDIKPAIENILEVIGESSLSDQEKEDYQDLIVAAQEQTMQDNPKVSWIQRGIRKLEELKQMITAGTLVVASADGFAQKVEMVIEHFTKCIQ